MFETLRVKFLAQKIQLVVLFPYRCLPGGLRVSFLGRSHFCSKQEEDFLGTKPENLKAKLVGGSKMFRFLSGDDHGIGFRNAEMARKQLLLLGIPIESEDVGGSVGRSAEFNIDNGLVQVMTVL